MGMATRPASSRRVMMKKRECVLCVEALTEKGLTGSRQEIDDVSVYLQRVISHCPMKLDNIEAGFVSIDIV